MHHFKGLIDFGAIALSIAGFLPYVPAILSAVASLLSIIWLVTRLYEYILIKKGESKNEDLPGGD